MSAYCGEPISIVLEAAEIRHEQWERVSNGIPPGEVIDELYEAAENGDESERLAHMQGDAIHKVREQLPARYSLTGIDTLATNAMCIWEHVLEVQRSWDKHQTLEEPLSQWLADGEGAFSARDGCWALAGWLEWAWNQITDEYDEAPEGFDAFDWDFTPVFINELYHVCSDRKISPKAVDEDYVRMAITAMLKS